MITFTCNHCGEVIKEVVYAVMPLSKVTGKQLRTPEHLHSKCVVPFWRENYL